ncbi:MAG: hypothetical protein ACKVWR_13620 [Acidimicrobiales bacterium]
MPRRVTPKREPSGPDELPPLRRRSPLVYWTAVLAVAALVLVTVGGVLAGIAGR